MISLDAAIRAIVYLIVAGLVFSILYWLLENVGIPEPFHRVARVVLMVAAALVLIGIILTLAGVGPVLFRP